MKPTKSDTIKKQLIGALEKSLGVVTTACKSVGIARSTFYDWYNGDKGFKKQVDSIENMAMDFVESKLYSLIQNNNPAAIIFYAKTKMKNRGYVERTEHTGKDGETLFNNMTEEYKQDIVKRIQNATK